MPLAQVREVFKPSFGVSVPPGAEFALPNPQPDTGGAGVSPGTSSGDEGQAPIDAVGPGPLRAARSGSLSGTNAPNASANSSHESVEAEAAACMSGGTLDSVRGLFELR